MTFWGKSPYAQRGFDKSLVKKYKVIDANQNSLWGTKYN